MSELIVYSESAELQRQTKDPRQIASLLKAIGVRFEQ